MRHVTTSTRPPLRAVGARPPAPERAPDAGPDSPDDDGADGGADDGGFTLVEILVAVVVVGILASVAVIGVQSLQRNGSLAACESSRDAANAASVAYYANSTVSAAALTYPTTLVALTGADPVYLELPPAAASPAGTDTEFHSAEGWTLEMTTAGTASAPPEFSCSITA